MTNAYDVLIIGAGVGGIRALHSPTTGIICPYGLTIALADNARGNGVDFHLGSEVTAILKAENGRGRFF